MRTYNRSLDCMALAVAQLLKGRPITAGQLLVKASKMPDVVEAINIIEASNKEAHARVVAAAKKTVAKKQVRAAEEVEEDDAIRGLVGDNEELEGDEDMEVESAMDADFGEEEPEEAEDEAIGKEDAEIAASLAKVLSAMTKRAVAAKKAPAKKR